MGDYLTKNSYKLLLILLFLSYITALMFNQNAIGEENYEEKQSTLEIYYGAEADFNTRYIWRGIPFSEGEVWQPGAWLTVNGFTAYLWGNYVLSNEINQGEFNEIDLYLYYTKEWSNFTIEPTLVIYFFPNTEFDTTAEAQLYLSYNFYGPWSITTSHFYDFAEYKGSYFGDIGLQFEKYLQDNLSVTTAISTGWGSSDFNDANIGIKKSALNVLEANFSMTYYPTDTIYIRPHFEFARTLDEQLRQTIGEGTVVNAGITIGLDLSL